MRVFLTQYFIFNFCFVLITWVRNGLVRVVCSLVFNFPHFLINFWPFFYRSATFVERNVCKDWENEVNRIVQHAAAPLPPAVECEAAEDDVEEGGQVEEDQQGQRRNQCGLSESQILNGTTELILLPSYQSKTFYVKNKPRRYILRVLGFDWRDFPFLSVMDKILCSKYQTTLPFLRFQTTWKGKIDILPQNYEENSWSPWTWCSFGIQTWRWSSDWFLRIWMK